MFNFVKLSVGKILSYSINLSSGSNLSGIDERSLKTLDKNRSFKCDRKVETFPGNKFAGKSNSFASPYSNKKISEISSPFNDSADLNISCDVGVLNVTRSKNGRRKSVLGKNVVYLLSSDSDSDASGSDKENEEERKEATPG